MAMAIVCFLLIVGSLLIPAYQAYLWVVDGAWTPLSTDALFSRILPDSFYVWLANDTTWAGLKQIVSYVVSDMSLFAFTFWSGLILTQVDSSRQSRSLKAKVGLPKDDNWDGWKEVRELIEEVDELRSLYKTLGYSPYVDKKAERLLGELKSLIRVEIIGASKSEWKAFQEHLSQLEEHFAKHAEEKNRLPSEELIYLQRLFANKDDYRKTIELLNESSLWKKHISDFGLVKKGHLTDQDRFLSLLVELEETFTGDRLPLKSEEYEGIKDRIAGVRKEIEHAEDFLSAEVLDSLKSTVHYAVNVRLIDDEEIEEKKEKLDDVLWNLVYVRHESEPKDPYYMDVTKTQAKAYVDSPWMHGPWLKNYILSRLLEAEIACRQITALSFNFFLVAVIGCGILAHFKLYFYSAALGAITFAYIFIKEWRNWTIRGLLSVYREVVSRVYDRDVLDKRLHKLERWGIQVQSIVYSLLQQE